MYRCALYLYPLDCSSDVAAYVALSELYMTDLCDEPEAESEARRLLGLATQGDPANPEGWQVRHTLHTAVAAQIHVIYSLSESVTAATAAGILLPLGRLA